MNKLPRPDFFDDFDALHALSENKMLASYPHLAPYVGTIEAGYNQYMVARVYGRATAGNAKRFLLDLLDTLPFPLLSVQVDGGSEFMADFERVCEELGVPLHVLPPRRPQFNGCVERANRSARAEFWSLYNGPLTVTAVAPRLNDYEFFYNYQRPHASLAYRTPNEYLVQMEAA